MESLLKVRTLKFKTITFLTVTIYLGLLSANTIAKSIYECKDSAGNIIYTDDPKSTPDCKTTATEKKVSPLPSFSSPNKSNNTAPRLTKHSSEDTETTKDTADNAAEVPDYSLVAITSPKENEAVNSCGGTLDISFTTSPNLVPGDLAVVLIDGQPYGEPTTSATISTTSLERGVHTAAVQILRNNEEVKRSADLSFMFMRNCAKKHN